MNLTKRQARALSSIRDPNQLEGLDGFAKTVINDVGRFGTILTVDRFEGDLRWHVSVSMLSEAFKPIKWSSLKPSEREAVRQLARDLLDDVGRPGSDEDAAEGKTYQIIRKLTL